MNKYIATVAYVAAAFLAISWLTVLAIDFADIFGLSTRMVFEESAIYHIFGEGSIVEMMQWTCIVTLIISTSFIAANYKVIRQQELFWFHMILSVIFGVMILEDAGNIRHEVARWLSAIFDGNIPYFISTVSLYSVLGLAVIFTTLKYGMRVLKSKKQGALYGAGFLAYGAASASSAGQYIWYDPLGAFLNSLAVTDPGAFIIMDLLYEESLELIGGICFVLFAASQFRKMVQDRSGEKVLPHSSKDQKERSSSQGRRIAEPDAAIHE